MIQGLQQRELELSQEKDHLMSQLETPGSQRAELAQELLQLKAGSQVGWFDTGLCYTEKLSDYG